MIITNNSHLILVDILSKTLNVHMYRKGLKHQVLYIVCIKYIIVDMKYNGLKTILTYILIILMSFTLILNFTKMTNPLNSVQVEGYGFFTLVKNSLITNPINNVYNSVKTISNLYNVYNENEVLRKQVDDISRLQNYNASLLKEVKDLKELLELDLILGDYNYVNSTIKSRSNSLYNDYVIIDQGKNSEILQNQAVINSDGLVGKIIEVFDDHSIVSLLTNSDKNNKVSVKIKINEDEFADAILEYYDSNKKCYVVTVLSANTSITKDMPVTTSGMGGVFPSSIMIGTVTGVEEINSSIALKIYVKPSVDFTNINYVKVINRN